MNLHELLIELRLKFGPLYDIAFLNEHGFEVNTPFWNEIGDNYRFFITYENHQFRIDDDGDALNNFEMYQLPDDKAKAFIKQNNGRIDDDMLYLKSDKEHLRENCFKLLRLQMGLTAIQQLTEPKPFDENDAD